MANGPHRRAIVLTIIAAALFTGSSYAATYQASTTGPWDSPSTWICTVDGPPGGACSGWPGNGGTDGDIATIASGTVMLSIPIPRRVTLDVSSGSLIIAAGGLSLMSGSNAAGSLSVTGGALTIPADALLDMTANGDVGPIPGTLTLSSGGIVNDRTINIPPGGGIFNWSGGVLAGGGSIENHGLMQMLGDIAAMTLDTQTIANSGSLQYVAAPFGLTMMNGATILNYADFGGSSNTRIEAGAGLAPLIVNAPAGNFSKSTGGGRLTISPVFNNDGYVSVATTGDVIAFDGGGNHTGAFDASGSASGFSFGGTHTFAGAASFGGGAGLVMIPQNGVFIVDTNLIFGLGLSNSGKLTWGSAPRVLSIAGNYSQTSTGTTVVRLYGTAAGQYDQVNVAGTASLGGTLDVSLGYVPANGDLYTPVTFAGGNGGTQFAINLPPNPNGFMTATYLPSAAAATSLQLQAVSAADIQVTEIGPANVPNGQTATYTITVKNLGPFSATNIAFNDTFPGASLSSAVATAGMSCTGTGPVSCTIAALAANASETLTLSIIPSATGTLTSTATINASIPTDPVAGNNSAFVQTTVDPSANLTISKNGPASATAGQNVVYTIDVKNNGPSDASAVVVTDNPPAGLTFVSNSGACTTPFPCTIASLLNGAMATITSTWKLSSAATGAIVNTANVSSAVTDPNTLDNAAQAATNVSTLADLAISKNGPASQYAGGQVTYTIVVTNPGPSDAAGVTVSDPTPAGLSWISNSGACTTAFPCAVGTVAAGASATITSTYAAGAAAVPSVTNTAGVFATTADNVPGNNTSSATTAINVNADLKITKTSSTSPVAAGQNAMFTTTVTNLGPSPANNVTIADPAPPGTTFVSNSGACTTAFPCNIGTLNALATATITSSYTIAPSFIGVLINTATVSASDPIDLVTSNNTATATIDAVRSADVGVSKSGPPSADIGSYVAYTVIVTNHGPSDSLPLTVSDPTPAGLMFVSNSGACTSAYPCTAGPLTAGTAATIISTYKVTATGGSITNAASVNVDPADSNGSNNTASAVTSIVPQADLAISKSGPANVPATGFVTFAISVRNNGPSSATSVIVDDPPRPGLTFNSNTGDCTTAFPCTFSSIAAGETKTIQAKFAVTGTASVTNTASVSSATADPAGADNNATWTVGPACPQPPVQTSPRSGATDVPRSGSITWTSTRASQYDVYLGPAGSGCTAFAPAFTVPGATTSVAYAGLAPGTLYESRIVSVTSGCPSRSSACVQWTTEPDVTPPALLEPIGGTLISPVTFRWTAVANATLYTVYVSVNGGAEQVVGMTTGTSLTVALPSGTVTWWVVASSQASPQGARSASATFNVCALPDAPLAGAVGAPTTGLPYAVAWNAVPGAVSYQIDEATDEAFATAVMRAVTGTSATFTHTTTTADALVFFYRVRAVGSCDNRPGPSSKTIRVVILPPPPATKIYPSFDIPAGTMNTVDLQVFIPGEASGPQNFAVTLDKPWMIRVQPVSGILPPEGTTVVVTIDPSQLPNGTFTGTLLVTLTPVSQSARVVPSGTSSTKSVPVSINLVTPVTPTPVSGPTADTIIIPVVGRLTGINSQWRSDVRVFNGSDSILNYQVDFLSSKSTESKRTTISTGAGDTTALDDIIHNWYGYGELGDSASGILQITALTTSGGTPSPLSTVVSSRTFNNTATNGTLGQFIPGIRFRDFIGKGESVLSLQQLAHSDAFRTNFGLLEASGNPATVLLSILDSAGRKLTDDFTVALEAGEQLPPHQVLAEKGITTNDARLEVRVIGGEGKVSAYASVVDNNSLDPLLVSPTLLGATTAEKYVLPGVANVSSGGALWRSDVRIHNGGTAMQTLDLQFYPQGDPENPKTATLTVNPGETKVLDNVVSSQFGLSNAGGAIHVNSEGDSQLVVTGRTFNQTANGTLGQFIPAATLEDGVGVGEMPLHILQIENSVRYRTNVGMAEMTGNPATVEVSVHLPDTKITPTVQIALKGNEFVQFAIRDMGLENIYNARVSIRVTEGSGRVTAYGSVIDMLTTDPTYVPAQ